MSMPPDTPLNDSRWTGRRLLMIAHTDAPWTPYYARYFASLGTALKVVSFSPDAIDGIDVEFVGVEPFDKYRNKHLFLTRIPRIRRIIREFQPDLVFAPYLISNGLTATLAWKGPLVISARGGDVLEHPGRTGWKRRFREHVIRWVCGRADRIHTVSEEIDRTLTALGVPPGKLARFPLGVNVRRFRPADDMPRTNAARIICTRKHEPVYNIPAIIDACGLLRAREIDFHCTFVGGGHLIDAHRQRADDLGVLDRLSFLGKRPHGDLPELLRAHDVYVSASLSDGTSSSLLEAMATGLLPVVSRITSNQAWIKDGETGWMFAPHNPDELADALERALCDAELRSRATIFNRRRVEADGDMERNMQRLADLFVGVLNAVRN